MASDKTALSKSPSPLPGIGSRRRERCRDLGHHEGGRRGGGGRAVERLVHAQGAVATGYGVEGKWQEGLARDRSISY